MMHMLEFVSTNMHTRTQCINLLNEKPQITVTYRHMR